MHSAAKQQRPSDEADKHQLELSRREGAAYRRSLTYMAEEVAHTGATKEVNGYLVGIAQEEAEGMYHLEDGELVWKAPQEENCHIEVSVSDADDNRFIPQLDVEVTLVAEDGTEVGPFKTPFLWHPGLYHYGRNVKVPGDGSYKVVVDIAAPTFPRHDKTNGKRYGEPVHVEFDGIDIKTGQD